MEIDTKMKNYAALTVAQVLTEVSPFEEQRWDQKVDYWFHQLQFWFFRYNIIRKKTQNERETQKMVKRKIQVKFLLFLLCLGTLIRI